MTTKMSKKKLDIGDYVFAKMRGHPPWPAKITAIIQKKSAGSGITEYYDVQFFGTNERGTCSRNLCYPYSTDYKSKIKVLKSKRYSGMFEQAIKEMEEEILSEAKKVLKAKKAEDIKDILSLERDQELLIGLRNDVKTCIGVNKQKNIDDKLFRDVTKRQPIVVLDRIDDIYPHLRTLKTRIIKNQNLRMHAMKSVEKFENSDTESACSAEIEQEIEILTKGRSPNENIYSMSQDFPCVIEEVFTLNEKELYKNKVASNLKKIKSSKEMAKEAIENILTSRNKGGSSKANIRLLKSNVFLSPKKVENFSQINDHDYNKTTRIARKRNCQRINNITNLETEVKIVSSTRRIEDQKLNGFPITNKQKVSKKTNKWAVVERPFMPSILRSKKSGRSPSLNSYETSDPISGSGEKCKPELLKNLKNVVKRAIDRENWQHRKIFFTCSLCDHFCTTVEELATHLSEGHEDLKRRQMEVDGETFPPSPSEEALPDLPETSDIEVTIKEEPLEESLEPVVEISIRPNEELDFAPSIQSDAQMPLIIYNDLNRKLNIEQKSPNLVRLGNGCLLLQNGGLGQKTLLLAPVEQVDHFRSEYLIAAKPMKPLESVLQCRLLSSPFS